MLPALERIRVGVVSIDEEAGQERAARPGFDRGPWVACLVGTLSLVFMEYGSERAFLRWLYLQAPHLYSARWQALAELGLWIGVRLVGFLVLPALAIRLLLRERVVDHGLRFGTLLRHRNAYLILFVLVLPCLLFAAQRPEFASYYPFYRHASASWLDLVLWELLYALHFIALEFFFRGFWLTACRRSFGSYAVLVAVAPYCMIHFTKPLLEVLAAIPAGIVLGLLAMRARSIWGGALLHVLVAYTMDALALLKTTGFPTQLWP